jgi:hypothetical protein
MISLVSEFRSAMADLFRTRRDSWVVAGLVLFGALVSAAELLAAQLFSTIIIPGEGPARSTNETIWLAIAFLVVFGGLRVLNFGQSLYRVNVFEKAFQGTSASSAGESWRWATAMELTSILSMVARIVVVSAALFLLSPLFAAANVLIALAVLQVFGMTLRRQLVTQQRFRKQQFSKDPASSADKVRARIKAGELGSLLSSVGVMILMAVLIALTILGEIPAGAALVSFLAVRMIGQMYSGISTGLMRFARARVNSD